MTNNRLRLYYFTLYGGLGSLFPFLNLFYRRHGLAGAEIGMLGTIAAAMIRELASPRLTTVSMASPRIQGIAKPDAVVAIRHIKARANRPQYFWAKPINLSRVLTSH